MSPMKRIRIGLYDFRKSITSRSVSTRSSASSRGVDGNFTYFLGGEGEADGGNLFLGAQRGDGHVVIAGAVADAVAGAVEGGERHQQDVGRDFGGFGLGLADAPLPARELVAETIGAHDERLAAPGNRRQRELGAGIGQLAHQRNAD